MKKKYNLVLWYGDDQGYYEKSLSFLEKGMGKIPRLKHMGTPNDLKEKSAIWTEDEIEAFLKFDDFKPYEKVVRASMVEAGSIK